MKTPMRFVLLSVSLTAAIALYAAGCGKKNPDDDLTGNESATEIAASSAAGALGSSTGSQGSMALNQPAGRVTTLLASLENLLEPQAVATTACPIMATSMGTCSSGQLTLAYNQCQFQKGLGVSYFPAVWNGSQTITFSGGCPGTFGGIKTGNVTLTRTLGSATTRTMPGGSVVTFDTSSPSGYAASVSGGMTAAFNSGNGSRSITINGIHYTATNPKGKTIWDHSVSTSSALNFTVTGIGTGTITSGTVQVQHNLAQYTASAAFNNVTFDHVNCGCFPTGGSITTTLTGSKTGTETITFNGCGTGDLTASDGSTSSITMNHCL